MQLAFDFNDEKGIVDEKKTERDNNTKSKKEEVSKKSEEVNLPVTIYGGPYTFSVSNNEKEVMNLQELKSEVLRHYPELDKIKVSLSKKAYGCEMSLSFEKADAKKMKEASIRSVKLGDQINMAMPYMMDGKEAATTFYREYPEYIGCSFQVVKEHSTMIPILEQKKEKRLYLTPINIGYTHNDFEIIHFEGTEAVSEKEILQVYTKKHPESSDGTLYYAKEEQLLIPLLEKPLKVDDKTLICAPITVKTGAYDIVFTDEDFGKEKVTLEEIRKALEEQFSEYSKERTEMQYDNNHTVVAILRGSKKGVTITPRKEGFEYHCEDGVVTEKHPYGSFKLKKMLTFSVNGRKIPIDLYYKALELFRETPTLERAVQIFQGPEGFFLYVPNQTVTEDSVRFKRSQALEEKNTLVMEIHSHGKFSAIFSAVDDQDEKGTRLYMVIGNLDANFPSIDLRAGMNGTFTYLKMEDVFEI